MLGERNIVKPGGDSLWNIARSRLGHGTQWRRLHDYNNCPEIVKITGRGIANPDLIYPGQEL